MQVIPLAADSMGVRSMSTFVEAGRARILIDPGAALAGIRYGLAPHPLEIWTLDKIRERIGLFAKSADTVVVTRYDHDHCFGDWPELFKGKKVLVKNPNLNVQPEWRKFAFVWLKQIRKFASEIVFADGRIIETDDVSFSFSKPRSESAFGNIEDFLQMVVVENNESFFFSSGTRGYYPDEVVGFIVDRTASGDLRHPPLLYLDGPSIYQDVKIKPKPALGSRLKGIKKLLTESESKHVILDHHPLRDPGWRSKLESLFHFAQNRGIRMQTAAEFRGEEILTLEARRNALYENHPQTTGME